MPGLASGVLGYGVYQSPGPRFGLCGGMNMHYHGVFGGSGHGSPLAWLTTEYYR